MTDEERIKKLLAEKEKSKVSEAKWPRPNEGEVYWFINSLLNSEFTTFNNDHLDNARFDAFNAFLTKEEADLEAERTKIWREVQWMAQQDCKYDGMYCMVKKGSGVITDMYDFRKRTHENIIGEIRFNSKEWARKAVDKLGYKLLKI